MKREYRQDLSALYIGPGYEDGYYARKKLRERKNYDYALSYAATGDIMEAYKEYIENDRDYEG